MKNHGKARKSYGKIGKNLGNARKSYLGKANYERLIRTTK